MPKEDLNKLRGISSDDKFIQLVLAWNLFIKELEAGYTYMIYEYINDLAHRSSIDRYLNKLSETEGKPLRKFLVKLDNRFFDVTFGISKPISQGEDEIWWNRAPRAITPHLIQEFRIYGIELEEELAKSQNINLNTETLTNITSADK